MTGSVRKNRTTPPNAAGRADEWKAGAMPGVELVATSVAASDQVGEFSDILHGFDFADTEANTERLFDGQQQRDLKQRIPLFNIRCRQLGRQLHLLHEE